MSKQYIKEFKIGTKTYYKDKAKKILHREDGPAIEFYDGTRAWYVNDKCHRLDGPAVEYAEGGGAWYVDDVYIFEVDKKSNVTNKIEG